MEKSGRQLDRAHFVLRSSVRSCIFVLLRSFFFIFAVTCHLLCRRQDGLEERRAVEVDQIIDALADADELDRDAETSRDGDDDTALWRCRRAW